MKSATRILCALVIFLMGINVSKGSEQLSFLVPVGHLDVLLQRVKNDGPITDFEMVITDTLLRDQAEFYGEILEKEWLNERFMSALLPGQIDDALECWGHTEDDKDSLYKSVHQHCRSSDEIYLSGAHSTGNFSYSYEWSETDELNRFQFYHLLERRFDHRGLNNVFTKKSATNFSCHTDFVKLSDHDWKVSSCLRAYKKYRGLYDASITIASVDDNDKALMVRLAAAGLSKENVKRLLQKFMEAIEWKR